MDAHAHRVATDVIEEFRADRVMTLSRLLEVLRRVVDEVAEANYDKRGGLAAALVEHELGPLVVAFEDARVQRHAVHAAADELGLLRAAFNEGLKHYAGGRDPDNESRARATPTIPREVEIRPKSTEVVELRPQIGAPEARLHLAISPRDRVLPLLGGPALSLPRFDGLWVDQVTIGNTVAFLAPVPFAPVITVGGPVLAGSLIRVALRNTGDLPRVVSVALAFG